MLVMLVTERIAIFCPSGLAQHQSECSVLSGPFRGSKRWSGLKEKIENAEKKPVRQIYG
jgi:hypothetical protein